MLGRSSAVLGFLHLGGARQGRMVCSFFCLSALSQSRGVGGYGDGGDVLVGGGFSYLGVAGAD